MTFDIPRLTEITLDDLEPLGTGAGILGTGGGGNPRIGRLRLQTLLEDDRYPDAIELISPHDLSHDATVASVGGMGAPTISVEKLPKGDEDYNSLRAIEAFSGEDVDAIIPGEIGGANSMAPLCVAAMADLPVVDGDGMGRAFPELQMDTFFIYGSPVNYAATTDERGNQVVYKDIDSAKRLEDFARAITVEMGGRSGYAFPLMTGAFVAEYAIPHTVSLATELGHVIERARNGTVDPVVAGRELLGGTELFTGKVIDVHRRNRDGFAMGSVTLAELDGSSKLEIEFQNEFLIAQNDAGETLTTVPDLICLVDQDTAAPVMTDALRYGQRVRVLGVPAPELLTTPEALDVIGPESFGYDLSYKPLDRSNTGW
ncbi:DUF917 domain-containing protein [Haladaptatus sp. CMSO5]|uniref:DUF917 domain-containing protein n=1 Tax=Haladaptatus sp. CMSO5 TaxID=3120514 RepID=UPI002FCE4F7F